MHSLLLAGLHQHELALGTMKANQEPELGSLLDCPWVSGSDSLKSPAPADVGAPSPLAHSADPGYRTWGLVVEGPLIMSHFLPSPLHHSGSS